jgi:hypothetical protein
LVGLLAVASSFAAGPVFAQQLIDPFAGSMAPGAPGPYGSDVGAFAHLIQSFPTIVTPDPSMLNTAVAVGAPASMAAVAPKAPDAAGKAMAPPAASDGGEGDKADAPDVPDSEEGIWEIVIGACAGGAFLGAYSAATATAPAVVTGVGAAATGTAIVSAAAIGCGLGVATATVSLGAIAGWKYARTQ